MHNLNNEEMKIKIAFVAIIMAITLNANSQNFSTWSGTIRFSGGLLGAGMVFSPMMTTWMIYEGFKFRYSDNGYSNGASFSGWMRDNHVGFLRFFNAGYDFLVPQWSMSFSNDNIKFDRFYARFDNTFHDLFFTNDCYINYMGYNINWKDPFSRFGFYFGADYELRKFSLDYTYNAPNQYDHWAVNNEIQSLVPSAGIRYRLISPEKEIEGFPINVVLEAGVSYSIILNFKNDIGNNSLNSYSKDALNNGFRTQFGVALTTNKYGAIYVRWIKDLYNLYNNDYIAKDRNGYLYGTEINTSTSYFSIGYSTFL